MENVTSFASVVNSLDFGAITSNILTVISVSAAFVIGLIAIRKGFAFLKRTIKGA